jgi:hypothetical protein
LYYTPVSHFSVTSIFSSQERIPIKRTFPNNFKQIAITPNLHLAEAYTVSTSGESFTMTYTVSEDYPHRREVITNRSTPMAAVQGRLKNVVHGRLKPGGDLATLMIFEFKFSPRKADRRIQSASIKLQFSNVERDFVASEIYSWAPHSTTFIVC